MAADDCYVHSEGLNVKRKEHPSEKQNTIAKGKAIATATTTPKRMSTSPKKNATSMKVKDHSINNRVGNHVRDAPNRPQHSYLLDSVAQVMTESQAHTPLKKLGENLNALNSAPLNTTSTTTSNTTTTTTTTTRASVSGRPVYNQTPTRPSIFGDDDDGSIDSDEGDDPILNFIQSSGKHGRGRGLGNGQEIYSGQSGSPSKSKSMPKSKDPNRFLADLDARISKDNHNRQEECECDEESQYPPHQQSQSQSQSQSESQQQQHNQSQNQGQPPINLLKSFVNTSNKMDWLRNVTQQDIQQSVSQLIPGIGKQNVNQSATTGTELVPLQNQYDSEDDDDNNDDKEKVHVVQSSALIGDRENAELMKIRQRMNMDFITLGLDIVDKNRNFLWIVVTFFVMMFGYIMTKNKTDDGSI
jgi:hypothetical protein